MLSPERSDMSDSLISDQDAYIAHLFYIVQQLNKKKVAQYSPVITVCAFMLDTCLYVPFYQKNIYVL